MELELVQACLEALYCYFSNFSNSGRLDFGSPRFAHVSDFAQLCLIARLFLVLSRVLTCLLFFYNLNSKFEKEENYDHFDGIPRVCGSQEEHKNPIYH